MQIVNANDCTPLANARVDVWHANALGLYSGYRNQRGVGGDPQSVQGQDYLRGIQFTDGDGRVAFQTVYPSWYYGRTPHVHFKILLDSSEALASQVFFPDNVNDDVMRNWDPYREHALKRTVTNANDMFLRNGIEGVFCEIKRTAEGYGASLVVAVTPPGR
jgi:protocatechuate 3,4-dioxygenase beta subunit